MRSFKEGKFLVFQLDDGRQVKYDLSNGDFIGFSGKKVKSLNDQLKGLNLTIIINSFEDENYKKFLRAVLNNINPTITNMGTFLSNVRKYSNLEQFYSAGLNNIDAYVYYKISEVPKGLINILKNDESIKLTNRLIECYIKNPNVFNNLIEIETKSITKDELFSHFSSTVGSSSRNLKHLIEIYNYNYKSLVKYIDYLMYYEGLNYVSSILRELSDYCRMCKAISRNGKFEKYPKHFLTTHAITIRNYNRLTTSYNENEFKARIKHEMEYAHGDYIFIYPKSTREIKMEAISLSHCVASYIQGIIDGEHDIIFLRNANDPSESLITLEVIDNKVTHSAGLLNRDPNKSEREAINKYNEFLGGM